VPHSGVSKLASSIDSNTPTIVWDSMLTVTSSVYTLTKVFQKHRVWSFLAYYKDVTNFVTYIGQDGTSRRILEVDSARQWLVNNRAPLRSNSIKCPNYVAIAYVNDHL